MFRKCSSCGREKELNQDNFHKKNKGRSGYNSRCKECVSKSDKDRYEKNKEKFRAEKIEYYHKNKESRREYQRGYYHDNKEKHVEDEKVWRTQNPHKRRIINASNRTKQHGAESSLTEAQWFEVMNVFGCNCAYCGLTEEEHLFTHGERLHHEHVVPLVMKGDYTIGNIVPSCRSCNSSKGNNNFFEWYSRSNVYDAKREKVLLDYFLEYS